MIRDRLVYTRSPEANAYLRAGVAALFAQYEADDGRAHWFHAVARDERLNGFGGSAERRQRAERLYDECRRALSLALHARTRALREAEQADLVAAALVREELAAISRDCRALRDAAAAAAGDGPPSLEDARQSSEHSIRHKTVLSNA
ncbi:hypothetical protein AB0F88_17205 [Streptosporangium sp. NPDC023963]|uniref:hypothetical protein n=1 Tax=Streptosporangium sp. NPDC023963 TaxID=3155608 RepID=UPI0034248263